MEDKMFELMEKMYAEFTEFRQETNQSFKKVDERMSRVEISIENDIKPKINLCIEELAAVKEKLIEHDTRFDAIESKIESQDVEIKVLKRVK